MGGCFGSDLLNAGSGGGGSGSWKSPVATVGDLPATGNTEGDVRQTLDTETLYSWNGTNWVAISGGGSGAVDSVQGLTGVVSLTTDDIPQGTTNLYAPTGGPNIFSYFDNSNVLTQLPNWNVDVTSIPNRYGLNYFASIDTGVAGANYSKTHVITGFYDPSVDNADDTEILLNLQSQLDPNNTGFGFGTSGIATRILEIDLNVNSSAAFGEVNASYINMDLGNDLIPGGSVTNFNGYSAFMNIHDGYTINNNTRGYQLNYNSPIGSTMTGGMSAFSANVNLLGSYNNYFNGFELSGNFAPTNSYSGSFFSFQNSIVFAGQVANPIAFNDGGIFNSGTNVTGDYKSANLGPQFNSGAVLRSATFLSISPQVTDAITNDVRAARFSLSGITAGDGITGLDIDLSNTTSTTSGISGIRISTNGAVGATGLNGIESDAPLSFNVTRSVLNNQTVQIVNRLEGLFTVASGSPVTGTDTLANNLAGDFLIEDDVPLGPIGIGMNSVGFIASMGIALGKTVDSMTVFLPAASLANAPFTTGGNITNFQHIRIFPPLAQGGTANITNLYAYKIDSAFGDYAASATNTWGLYLDTTAQNYIKGSLNIGAVTTKVANASVGFEIGGTTKAILLPRMTTTQRNALTALEGMFIYNLTTKATEYYDGTNWV